MGCSQSAPWTHSGTERPFGKRELERSQRIRVQLKKDAGKRLGFEIIDIRGLIVISKIAAGGMLADWNEINPDQSVLPGDAISAVNNIPSIDIGTVTRQLWIADLITLDVSKIGRLPQILNTLQNVASEVVISETNKVRSIDSLEYCEQDACLTDECAICFDDFEESERVVRLPCKHGFHHRCLASWMAQNQQICPICRQAVTSQPQTTSLMQESVDLNEVGQSMAEVSRETGVFREMAGEFSDELTDGGPRTINAFPINSSAGYSENLMGWGSAPMDDLAEDLIDAIVQELTSVEELWYMRRSTQMRTRLISDKRCTPDVALWRACKLH